jgi:transposase InsO family protein
MSRGFVQCASFRQPQSPAQRADGLLSDGRGLGLAERTLSSTRIAANFLRALLKAVPYKVHTVLTDNGTHFTTPGNLCSAAAEIRLALERGEVFRAHAFEFACAQNDVDHRLTKPRHPWTNG